MVPASETRSRLTREDAALTARLEQLPLNGAATLGAEWLRESGHIESSLPMFDAEPSGFALERRTGSQFGEWRSEPFDRLLVVISVRRDAVNAITSPAAGLRYRRPHSNVVLRANWAKGFKLPSFFALGHPVVGNPELAPELSRSVELGGEVTITTTLLSVKVFQSRFINLIDFDSDSFRMVNRDRVRARGLVLEGRSTLNSRTVLSVNYTFGAAPD